MKSIHCVLIILIISFLLTTPSVIAQDKDPPSVLPEPSQDEPQLSDSPQSNSVPLSSEGKKNFSTSNSTRTNSRNVTDESGVICLACTDDYNESNQAIAHGGDYYIVVFAEGGYVHAYFFEENGSIYAMYSNIEVKSDYPDVAYEANTGLFILTWRYDFNGDGSDYDIHAAAFSPETGVVGSIQWVASSFDHETDPSVDCNPDDSSCLVAYEFDDGANEHIDGHFMDMSVSGVSSSSSSFTISTTNNDSSPHVAFGDLSYLVAYTWDDSSDVPWPVYSHVHPVYQTTGNQYMHTTSYLINPGDLADDHIKYTTGAAFDGCARTFVVTFMYDFGGSDNDIGARGVHQTNATVYNFFWVAWTTDSEMSADISFIEDYHLTDSPPHASKLVVAYERTYGDAILSTDLVSNCSHTSPSYSVDPPNKHFLVKEPYEGNGSLVIEPSVTGAGGFEHFLVAWVDAQGEFGPDDFDVLGRLMDASEKNYLPLNNK